MPPTPSHHKCLYFFSNADNFKCHQHHYAAREWVSNAASGVSQHLNMFFLKYDQRGLTKMVLVTNAANFFPPQSICLNAINAVLPQGYMFILKCSQCHPAPRVLVTIATNTVLPKGIWFSSNAVNAVLLRGC